MCHAQSGVVFAFEWRLQAASFPGIVPAIATQYVCVRAYVPSVPSYTSCVLLQTLL